MNHKLRPVTRIISLVAAIAIAAVIFLPIWKIDLAAPQYPEGLYMQIYANKLGGDVDIINGLNHYIGMNHIDEKDFVEFQVMPGLIIGLAIFGLLTAIINRKWFFFAWFGFILAFGIVAMMDFYRWLYNYGHNLDPAAAIKVPGQSYQPPLLGYKQLLNFGAYSMPDSGGWIFFGAGILLLAFVWIEIKDIRKKHVNLPALGLLLLSSLLLTSCKTGPKEIPYGKAPCDHCKMTIMDKRFGAELITAKGKIFYFDELTCLNKFRSSQELNTENIAGMYVSDFNGSGQLLAVENAFFARGESIRGPMGGSIAAFPDAGSRDQFIKGKNLEPVDWKSINQ